MLADLLVPAGAGIAAGLGVAMPLGAVAALLLREGVVNGFRVAAAAAGGVAAVDITYCTIATLAGAAIAPAVESRRALFLTLSGLLIVAIGLRQLISGLRHRAVAAPTVEPVSPISAFVKFVGLTAINPLTLIYFVALAGAITTQSESPLGPAVFVVAVGISSLAWQLILASAGSLFGRTVSVRTTEVIGIAASILIVGLGALIALRGLGWS